MLPLVGCSNHRENLLYTCHGSMEPAQSQWFLSQTPQMLTLFCILGTDNISLISCGLIRSFVSPAGNLSHFSQIGCIQVRQCVPRDADFSERILLSVDTMDYMEEQIQDAMDV